MDYAECAGWAVVLSSSVHAAVTLTRYAKRIGKAVVDDQMYWLLKEELERVKRALEEARVCLMFLGRKSYDRLVTVLDALLRSLKPGLPIRELDLAVRDLSNAASELMEKVIDRLEIRMLSPPA